MDPAHSGRKQTATPVEESKLTTAEIATISGAMDVLQERFAEWDHAERHKRSSHPHLVESAEGSQLDVSKMTWKNIPEGIPYKEQVREQGLVYRQAIEEQLVSGQPVDDDFFRSAGQKIAKDFEISTVRGHDLLGSDPEFRQERLKVAFGFYEANAIEG